MDDPRIIHGYNARLDGERFPAAAPFFPERGCSLPAPFALDSKVVSFPSMDSSLQFSLPETAPGITLPGTVLFPQATMPLFIFEPRYRRMLEEVLGGNHLMIVATQDEERARSGDAFEPYHPAATLGMVQSSQKNSDGTSSILVQGIIRVNAETTCQEEPYRVFAMRPVESEAGAPALDLEKKATHLIALIRRRSELGGGISREILRFFESIDNPEILADIVAFTLVSKTDQKLRLLRSPVITSRLDILLALLREEIREIELIARLKGGLDEDRIPWN